jgi:hypothetical protein
LCALIADPFDMADKLTKKDRQRLRKAKSLSDNGAPAWLLVPAAIRAQGQIAFGVLVGS